jgi:hypothetical protein
MAEYSFQESLPKGDSTWEKRRMVLPHVESRQGAGTGPFEGLFLRFVPSSNKQPLPFRPRIRKEIIGSRNTATGSRVIRICHQNGHFCSKCLFSANECPFSIRPKRALPANFVLSVLQSARPYTQKGGAEPTLKNGLNPRS